MNKALHILSLGIMLLLCICSCTPDPLDPAEWDEGEQYVKEITAAISAFVVESEQEVAVKATIDEGEGDEVEPKNTGFQPLWAELDTIGLFTEKGFSYAFPVSDRAGGERARFSGGGWGLDTAYTYSAFAPLTTRSGHNMGKLPLMLSGQKQSGNHNSSHISLFDYKSSLNNAVSARKVGFTFNHHICILHLVFTIPQAGDFRNLVLETSGRFVSEASLDLTSGKIKETKYSAIQAMALDNVKITDPGNDKLELFISVLPVDLSESTLCAKIYDSNGICYTAELKGRKFEAGVFYNIEREASVDAVNTGLPTMLINTPGNVEITSRDEWLENASITLINKDGSVSFYDDSLQIKGRGNSTWSRSPVSPGKKPYSLKLSKKAKLLGMPKHKRWALLANFYDRTLIRNSVAFQIARCTDLEWTPSGGFVELVLNGTHVGNYYLCEQIKIDKNRLNIQKMTPEDIEDDALTGGYLMELDGRMKEVNHFWSLKYTMPYNFRDPDEDDINEYQIKYMQQFVKEMESSLHNDTKFGNREFENYMDIDSYIDWWFVYELTQNNEPRQPAYGGKPLSCYAHKDRLGKMKMGPVWDFDVYTFTPNMPVNAFAIKTAIYYGRLFQDAVFVERVKERWNIHKEKFSRIPDYMQSEADKVRASNAIDKTMWPNNIFQPNGDDKMSFDDAIDRMKSTYISRLEWLDKNIATLSAK